VTAALMPVRALSNAVTGVAHALDTEGPVEWCAGIVHGPYEPSVLLREFFHTRRREATSIRVLDRGGLVMTFSGRTLVRGVGLEEREELVALLWAAPGELAEHADWVEDQWRRCIWPPWIDIEWRIFP
jgi:hypothetical protein